MQAIRKTLIQNLFLSPKPQSYNKKVKHYYTQLYTRIFPDPEEFKEFLMTNDIDKQIDLAEKIIRRLCFDSNFAPPYSSMRDVFCIENRKRSFNGGKYHPSRDHFLHIVNLYMLGIYIFFYNKVFYNNIIHSYKYKRVEYEYENSEINLIKDYISSWKYFCLYHDIGYCIELLSNPDNNLDYKHLSADYGLSKTLSKNTTKNQILFESALKLMSKILFAKEIIENTYENLGKTNPIVNRKKRLEFVSFKVHSFPE